MKRLFLTCLAVLLCLNALGDKSPEVLAWDFTQGLHQWRPDNFQSFKATPRGFEGVSKYDCTFTSPLLKLNAADYDQAIVTVSTSIGGSSDLFIASNGQPFSDARKMTVHLSASENTQLLKFSLDPRKGWAGTIERLRFDPVNPAGAKICIESLMLCKKSGNMLANGDFELNYNGVTKAWTLANGATVANDAPASGAKCLILNGKGATAQTPFADVSWLGSYNLTFLHSGAAAQAVVELRERHGATVLKQVIDIPASDAWTHQTALVAVPDMAYEGTLSFNGTGGNARIDKITVTQVTIGNIKTPRPVAPFWQGYWIWCYENRGDDNCTAWLRKSIVLPDKHFNSACVQLTCDDSVAFYVNGQKVCDTHGIEDAWKQPVVLDIAKYLKPGNNIFLAEARDIGDAQGFITNIAIDMEGTFVTVNSGADWEGAVKPDGPWSPAAVVGKPPCAPWNALPYRPMGTMPCLKAKLGKTPETARARETVSIPVIVEPYSFDGAIGVKATLAQDGKTIAEGWDPKGLTQNGAAATIVVPCFVKPGPATITVTFPGATTSSPLTVPITLKPNNDKTTSDYPVTKLVQHNGVTWISVDGKLHDPTQVLYNVHDELQVSNGQAAGVEMVDIILEQFGFYEDGFNYDKLDEKLAKYLTTSPDAFLFFNFSLSAYRSHKWWLEKHPEALCRHEDGSSTIGGYAGERCVWPSYSSPVWRQDFGNALRQMLRHLRNTPFASRVIGIHPSCGISYEWFNWGSQTQEFVDYSDCAKAAFRQWLKAKYATDDALRKAWNRPDVTLDSAPMPSSFRRANPEAGRYFDVTTQRDVLDYHEFQHWNVADTIRYFCHIVKEETQGNVLTGTYYGYTCYLFENRFFGQNSGHFNLRHLLDSPDFDFFMAPVAYTRREVGGPALTMVPEYTHTLNGKLFWSQADLRTHWSPQRYHGNVDTIRGDVECMNRELARTLAEGTAVQWYDFSHGWTMGDKRLTEVLKEHIQLVRKYRDAVKDFPAKDYMLYVIDENAVGTTNVYTPFYYGHLVNSQRIDAALAGVPWRTVLLSDLFRHADRLLEHNTIVFLAPDKLSEQQARFIKDRVMKDGRTVAFIGNLGVFGENGLSTAIAEDLLGRRFTIATSPINLTATCTSLWPELEGKTYGTSKECSVQSVMMPESLPESIVLARLAQSQTPAAFYESRQDCNVLWSAAPHFSPDVLRALAKRANLPIVADSDDNIYAGHGFVGIHAHSTGTKTLKLIGKGTPKDILTGKTWPKGTDTIQIDLECGDTRIFVME